MSNEKTVDSVICFSPLFSDAANSNNMPAPAHKKILCPFLRTASIINSHKAYQNNPLNLRYKRASDHM